MYGDCIYFADLPYGTFPFFVFFYYLVSSKLPRPLNK